ncbi:MAG: periplasmic heavy metal sensor [Pseudomonadales bacterium]|nr:periplasmic heavy metal sensor [Pseudomonadales bacterium]
MSRKALIIACVISLVVNLGFVGFFVGKSFAPHVRIDRVATWTSTPLERTLRPLGPERVQELIPNTREHRKMVREGLKELRRAQSKLYRATVEEPFDAARLKVAQEEFNELFLAAKSHHDEMWLEVAVKLQPAERQQIMSTSMPRRHNEDRRRAKPKVPKIPEVEVPEEIADTPVE